MPSRRHGHLPHPRGEVIHFLNFLEAHVQHVHAAEAERELHGLIAARVVALGYPMKRHTKLTRRPVEQFTTIDAFDGEPLEA